MLLFKGHAVHASTAPLAANVPLHTANTHQFPRNSPHWDAGDELEYAASVESLGRAVGPDARAIKVRGVVRGSFCCRSGLSGSRSPGRRRCTPLCQVCVFDMQSVLAEQLVQPDADRTFKLGPSHMHAV